MPSGAELFAESLVALGIERLFTLVGDHLNDALIAGAARGLQIVDMRHESGCTHAADTWARLHRKPAIALITGGPGLTNALTGIATAQLIGSPLIAVSGSRASHLSDCGAFQDIDQLALTRPIVKWAGQPPNAARIPFYLQRAYTEANTGRKGAVHLNIPIDLFAAQAPEAPPAHIREMSPSPPNSRDLDRAMALLREAERPIVIAGSGVWWADAGADLLQFIERTSLPLFTIGMARGMVSDDHPLCFGYADPALNRAALRACKAADVVLVLGKRIDYRLAMGGPRLFAPAARFIQVDIHAGELGMNRGLAVAIAADVKQTLHAFNADPCPTSAWLAELRQYRRKWQAELDAADNHPAALFRALKACLPGDALYSWDGGDFVHWGRAILPAKHAGGWVRLGPLGTIGSALPNAIALKLAHPDRPVVLFTGDGALGFYLAELDTAVRQRLPMVIIVGNDGGWGLERELQRESVSAPVACELSRARYDLVTMAFGGNGESIDSPSRIAPALERALASPVPYCINFEMRGARSPFTDWQLQGKAGR